MIANEEEDIARDDCGNAESHSPDIDDLLSSERPLPFFDVRSTDKSNELASRVSLAKILVAVQQHSATHTFTCFKRKNKGCECRMNLPAPCFFDQSCTDPISFKIRLQRELGCNYLNKTNYLLPMLLRCNTDVALLLLAEPGLVHYVCSYVTKDQQAVEFVAEAYALTFAARKLAEDNMATTLEEAQRTANRIQGVLHKIQGKQQVSEPMAATELLGYGISRTSEVFAPLNLTQIRKATQGEEVAGDLVRDPLAPSRVIRVNSYHDYIGRPRGRHQLRNGKIEGDAFIDFDTIGCYKYVAYFQRVPKSQVQKNEEPLSADESDQEALDDESASDGESAQESKRQFFLLDPSHPLAKSHVVVPRSRLHVPVIYGKRIPDRSNLQDDGMRNDYALEALLLFKPFRKRQDIVGGHGSDWLAYRHWLEHDASEFDKRILNNMQDFYDTRAWAKQRAEEGTNDLDDQPRAVDFDRNSDEHGHEDDLQTLFEDLLGDDDDSQITTAVDDLLPIPAPLYVNLTLQQPYFSLFDKNTSRAPSISSTQGKSVADLKAAMNSTRELKINGEATQTGFAARVREAAALDSMLLIEKMNDALARIDSTEDNRAYTPETLPSCPRMEDVMRAFNLNRQQRSAFEICALALLKTWRADELKEELDRPLRHIINGEGGTGKSTVVRALVVFSTLWGRPNAVKTLAYAGLAAINIGGMTLHTGLDLAIFVPKTVREAKAPNENVMRQWHVLLYFIFFVPFIIVSAL